MQKITGACSHPIGRMIVALLLFIPGGFIGKAFSQTTTITTEGTGFNGLDSIRTQGAAHLAFLVDNSNFVPVKFTGVSNYIQPRDNDATWTLFYSATSTTGPSLIPSSDWTEVGTSGAVPVSYPSITPIFQGLNVIIPARTAYRFVLRKNAGPGVLRLSNLGAKVFIQNNFLARGVYLKIGNFKPTEFTSTVGFVGGSPGLEYGTGHFTGSITFDEPPACTAPAVPQILSSSSTVCIGQSFTLKHTNPENGQTFQWQSSDNNVNWSPIFGATGNTYTITQTTPKYYRMAVTCGVTVFSSPVFVGVPAPVSGSFVIDSRQASSGRTFRTFSEAVNQLCNINGPVVIDVAPGSGPYNERVVFGEIGGTSATNTLTVRGNGATLFYSGPTSDQNAVLTLNGSDNLVIDGLNLNAGESAYGAGIVLQNRADNNIVKNCSIVLSKTAIETNSIGVLVDLSAGNKITANMVTGGRYGIYINGNSSVTAGNNEIRLNTISDFFNSGIFLNGSYNALIEGNDVSRPHRDMGGFSVSGIFLNFNEVRVRIIGNRVHDIINNYTGTSYVYGISLFSSGASAGNETVASNNLIYRLNNTGNLIGLRNSSSYAKVFHNTISLDHPDRNSGSFVRGYEQGSNIGVEFKNNNISVTTSGEGTKHAVFVNALTGLNLNFNNYYVGSTAGSNYVAGTTNANFSRLPDWQAASGQDAYSVALNPLFINPANGDYSISAPLLKSKGTFVGVTADINNKLRNTKTPDIGAFESEGLACSSPMIPGSATSLTTAAVCPGSPVKLSLINYSSATGQTYQWETSTSANGTYSAAGNLMPYPDTTVMATAALYYRVAIRCSNEVQYSEPVAITVSSGLAGGAYTINPALPTGSNNFQRFSDAIVALKCGITGPVVFDVAAGSGPYNEQVIFDSITGASAVNTITINGNGAVLKYSSSNPDDKAVIKLNKADYVTIDSLVIDATGAGSDQFGVQLINNADFNTVRRCTIIVDSVISYNTNFAGIVVSAAGNNAIASGATNCDNNTFERNRISGGYYGITIVGGASALVNGNRITNNIITDFFAYGLFASYTNNLLVESNSISRPYRTRVANFEGIFFQSTTTAARVSKNRLFNPFGGKPGAFDQFYAIRFSNASGTAAIDNVVANNLVYDVKGQGSQAGIYNESSSYLACYHNTIVFDDSASRSGSIGFYSGATNPIGVKFRNNNIYIRKSPVSTSYALSLSSSSVAANITESNNNLFTLDQSGKNYILRYGNAQYATLAAVPNGLLTNTVAIDPFFADLAGGNLRPTSILLNDKGVNVGIATDFAEQVRNTTAPDIGAFEFTGVGCSAPTNGGAAYFTRVDSIPSICLGTQVRLNVKDISTGPGMIYQWVNAQQIDGSFSAITSWGPMPNTSFYVVRSGFYKVAVACGGEFLYSEPVFIEVPTTSAGGTFTINSALPTTGSNFRNFRDAIKMISCGISGPVTFNVAPGSGPYDEQVIVDSIKGTSAINTVTFNGNGALIRFNSSSTSERAAIKIRRAKYIKFDSLVVDTRGQATGQMGIQLTGNSDYNTVRRCTVYLDTSDVSTSSAGIALTSTIPYDPVAGSFNCDFNTVEFNTITGGDNGISLVGDGNLIITGNQIRYNTIKDSYLNGISALYQRDLLVEGNTISRPLRSSASAYQVYGIQLQNNRSVTVVSNRVHSSLGSPLSPVTTFTAIQISFGVAGADNLVANNLIYDISSTRNATGIGHGSSGNMTAHHNTIVLNHASTASQSSVVGFLLSGDRGTNLLNNNIVSIAGNGNGFATGIVLSGGTLKPGFIGNKNNYFIERKSNHFIGSAATSAIANTRATTLEEWQALTGQDAQTLTVNPQFVDPLAGDFRPSSAVLDDKGMPVNILTDISGQQRNVSTPDPGAYEFTAQPCVNPPTAGSSVVSAIGAFNGCSGTEVRLSLSGNSYGAGQTYLWQRATDATGPYVEIGNESMDPDTTISASGNFYYRARVGCGGTVAYSTVSNLAVPTLLSGTYTVNREAITSGRNFQTFTDAVNAIACGIDGPVVFKVAPGIYNEQLVFKPMPGASATNTVVFEPADGNRNSVEVSFMTSAASLFVLRLDSVRYLTLRALKITSNMYTTPQYGRAIEFNDCSNDSIIDCTIKVPESTDPTTGFLLTGIYGMVSNGVFFNNTITGGNFGMLLSGDDIAIRNNVITSRLSGATVSNSANLRFTGNTVTSNGTAGASVNLINCGGSYEILNNSVSGVVKNVSAKGMAIYNALSTAQNPGIVRNNLVGVGNESYTFGPNPEPNLTATGLLISASHNALITNNVAYITNASGGSQTALSCSGTNLHIYNNSVRSTTASEKLATGAVMTGADINGNDIIVRNNIISHSGIGLAMKIGSAVSSDYNNLFSPQGNLVQSGASSTIYQDLASWRAASGNDKHSLSIRPAYLNFTPLVPDTTHPEVWGLHGHGIHIPGNDKDKNGNPRPTTLAEGVPDLGAYEFTPRVAPPVATAFPEKPIAGTTQTFLFATDTIAIIRWAPDAPVPASIMVRRYSGVRPPSLPMGSPHMYFYDSIKAEGGGAYNYDIDVKYKDVWLGTITNETGLKLAQANPAGNWNTLASSDLNTTTNTMSAPALNSFGLFTGLTNAGTITFSGKVFLQGAYNSATGIMSNSLNSLGILQEKAAAQPYATEVFKHYANEGVPPGFFAAHSDIVDWVLIELRSSSSPGTVVARRAAFVKRDGTIVEIDGTTNQVTFNGVTPAGYFVSIRHRNHLGIRSATILDFSGGAAHHDFTTSSGNAFQSQAYTSTLQLGTIWAMRAGDANANGNVRYAGPGNDHNQILNLSLGGSLATVLTGVYAADDINMDGSIKFNGPVNDQNFLLNLILSGSLSTILLQQL
ncbi:hypothetical protein EXU57_08800 [Segetibacter sp. 3557_3]|uniref:right-handed parallel beta-helix repeat-containing protein n=1 Tax=Segetibacter sp. 3557_3 TaxID=2547429 RepID=UPI001058E781|nr:right-handed parallel beta-helix repeat-containing protein [Segetibacter sp. 3557_3]TDH26894.1 hypothetical protein EXU57_08800 [Segetibacter sp. 3557_3]